MHFVTVDAETDVIREGVRLISELRDGVEAKIGLRIPIVWFVRFQRTWDEYVENDSPDYFDGPYRDGFDGFALAKAQLLELRGRGDEIGWHYHAYNYVHREDLGHSTRMRILESDLGSCARELRARHPELPVQSFRFGWLFVPDYRIYETLRIVGMRNDASQGRETAGARVPGYSATYLGPLVTEPTEDHGLMIFPHDQTFLLHDWTVVRHAFGWSSQGRRGARKERRDFVRDLSARAARLKAEGVPFLTYETVPRLLPAGTSGA